MYEELNILRGVIGLGGMPLNQTSSRQVTDEVRRIVEDLEYLSRFEEVGAEEFDSLLNGLKSEEVKRYINYLLMGSKPESALREALFAGDSVLFKYLRGTSGFEVAPEVVEDGFVDYLVKDQFGHVIVIELKSLFDTIKDRDKSGRITVKGLKQKPLSWEKHREQIKEYIAKSEYVVLSNLKEWVFFSRSLNPVNPKPFFSTTLQELVVDLEVIGSLKDYCDRKDSQAVRYELDKKFLESLKQWVEKLSEIEFTVDDKRKLELIIGLINKFIFIQTLDDYGVVDFKWIQKNWEYYNSSWIAKGKLRVLEEFFKHVDQWFYAYYDTELFREDFLRYVKKDPANIDRLYENLRMVLGITYFQTPIGFRGIMQYNFRLIDEDVLGKAYEIFLAEQRKEQGAYYTPKYITEYIVENTVGRIFKGLLDEINKALESEDFDKARELVIKFTSIKVLDPACGSGSFLIKALRKIKHMYDMLNEFITKYEEKYNKYLNLSLESLLEVQDKLGRINEIKKIVGPDNNRELISRIILRHIHGNDLDRRALEVAKLNIWLEAIKLAPSEFRYDRLPSRTEHILPNLGINFGNGDSLVGLPFEDELNYLISSYKKELSELSRLRSEYIDNPTNPTLIETIENIKQKLRWDLDREFKRFLSNNSPLDSKAGRRLDLTKLFNLTLPFHWCLEFWFAYFDEDGEPLENKGFDVIIGNPPYGRIKQLIKEKEVKNIYSKYYDLAYSYQKGNYNYYKLFLERCFNILKDSGYFSMIFPTAFLGEQDSQPLRKLFFENAQVLKILQFPEKTRVFEDVTQDVIVLVYRKIKSDVDYSFQIRTNILNDELEKLDKLDFIELRVSEVKEVTGGTYRIPLFVKPEIEWVILKKISKIPPFKGNDRVPSIGEIGEGHLHETFDKDFLSERETGDLVVKGIHLDQYFVNLDPEGPHPRWVRKRDFLRKKKEAEENIRYERIIGRNTLNRAIRPRLRFTILKPGIIITNAIKYIVLKDAGLDKYYLIGLLNSSLLNWRFELFSSQNNIRNYEIEELPIYRADRELQRVIADKVKKILELKSIRYQWLKIWSRWQKVMKNKEVSLSSLLQNDLNLLRLGNTQDTWTINSSFYLTTGGEGELNKEYADFRILGRDVDPSIEIHGITNNNDEEAICFITFKNRELMLHVYLSLLVTLESRGEVKTLPGLFKRTQIPVIEEKSTPSSNLTPNILKKAWEEVEAWVKHEGVECPELDIARIDNLIEELKGKIDALVFRIYGLEEGEVEVVLSSLKLSPRYRRLVLDYFRMG